MMIRHNKLTIELEGGVNLMIRPNTIISIYNSLSTEVRGLVKDKVV